ncbi:MAG TPA: tetratricopeptide repeat protein [Spirochaetota bacterium]|nr:tetratricopeptide repeat protein [Spirochaetota bacterium]HQO01092.1 tetratricopeptide repeat protein [Spirochaetota bacterium]
MFFLKLHISTIKSVFLYLLGAVLFVVCAMPASAQQDEDYRKLYNDKNYAKSLEVINKNLSELYNKETGGTAGKPTGLDLLKTVESGKKLLKEAFRNRRAVGFFVKDNEELFTLHVYAARCYYEEQKYPEALNHYDQALRYRSLRHGEDDKVFYEIAQVYKKQKRPEPYRRMMEQAYTLNTAEPKYSLELGVSLANTTARKKAIHHLERYIQAKGEADDPKLYLMVGNLYEDIGRYLDTVDNYRKYLKAKPDDGYIHYALGYLAYKRTGNFTLADQSFGKALEHLPEDDILRRSRINEYRGDMYMKDLDFDRAAEVYEKTVTYQEQIVSGIRQRIEDIKKIRGEIAKIKATTGVREYYSADTFVQGEKKEKLELENRDKRYLFEKMNPGKVRWNLAVTHERRGDLQKAITFYRKAITYSYKSDLAREKIIKLQLKINRGY